MGTTDSKTYKGKHRDDSWAALLRNIDNDVDALVRGAEYVGKHRTDDVAFTGSSRVEVTR